MFARYFFYVLGDYDGIGFSPFGVDSSIGGKDLSSWFSDIAANYRLIGTALPVIAELQGTGKLKAAVEEEWVPSRWLYFDQYEVLCQFRPPAGDEFLIIGFDTSVQFRPMRGSGYTGAQLLQAEEGVYENGVWKPTMIRGGSLRSLRLPPAGAMIRVKLIRY
jgi:hypothetical protein